MDDALLIFNCYGSTQRNYLSWKHFDFYDLDAAVTQTLKKDATFFR